MRVLVYTDIALAALVVGLCVPSIRHYLVNWRARPRRNPESPAIAIVTGALAYGAVMSALAAVDDPGRSAKWAAYLLAVFVFVAVNLFLAIREARVLYAAQDDRKAKGTP